MKTISELTKLKGYRCEEEADKGVSRCVLRTPQLTQYHGFLSYRQGHLQTLRLGVKVEVKGSHTVEGGP